MMNRDLGSLIALIKKFVNGDDVSIASANAIEVGIDNAFPDEEYMQDVVLMLASYRPEGGDYLYGETDMRKMLAKVLEKLQQEAGSNGEDGGVMPPPLW